MFKEQNSLTLSSESLFSKCLA